MSNKIVIFLIILFFKSVNIQACSCIGRDSVDRAFQSSKFVISGKVVKLDTFNVTVSGIFKIPMIKAKIAITKAYKGRLFRRFIDIITGLGGGDCGFKFYLNQDYIIYSIRRTKFSEYQMRKKGHNYTDICSRTCHWNKVEENLILGHLKNKLLQSN